MPSALSFPALKGRGLTRTRSTAAPLKTSLNRLINV
jgi:hypothetical protein